MGTYCTYDDSRRQQGRCVGVERGLQGALQVGANGRTVTVLQGADGTLFKEHLGNCVPCHHPNIDLTIAGPHPDDGASQSPLATRRGCCCVTIAWRGGTYTWGV